MRVTQIESGDAGNLVKTKYSAAVSKLKILRVTESANGDAGNFRGMNFNVIFLLTGFTRSISWWIITSDLRSSRARRASDYSWSDRCPNRLATCRLPSAHHPSPAANRRLSPDTTNSATKLQQANETNKILPASTSLQAKEKNLTRLEPNTPHTTPF